MLRNESPKRQQQIVSRIWAAIGIKPDSITDELFDEWLEALADLEIDAITQRVEHWKAQGRTCPADEFAEPIPHKIDGKMTAKEIVEKAKKLYTESAESFEESYRNLHLHTRWGELPEDHPHTGDNCTPKNA